MNYLNYMFMMTLNEDGMNIPSVPNPHIWISGIFMITYVKSHGFYY